MHQRLARFIEQVDDLTRGGALPAAIADGVAQHLAPLIVDASFLDAAHRRADPVEPRANLVHVSPSGAFSLVALVWEPGQETCVHDHVSWCVVGVLEGAEEETRYRLMRDEGGRYLERGATRRLRTGEVCTLVPPDEDVHQVRNVGRGLALSLHVYGADIGRLGTSINRRFTELAQHAPGERVGVPVRWRDEATPA